MLFPCIRSQSLTHTHMNVPTNNSPPSLCPMQCNSQQLQGETGTSCVLAVTEVDVLGRPGSTLNPKPSPLPHHPLSLFRISPLTFFLSFLFSVPAYAFLLLSACLAWGIQGVCLKDLASKCFLHDRRLYIVNSVSACMCVCVYT